MKKSYLVILLSVLVSGCTFYNVNGEAIHYNSPDETANKQIQYLETVNVPYDVVGQVTVYTERRNSLENVAEQMKRQAAILGGDAVTNITITEPALPFKTIRTTFTGTVIVFKKDQPAAAAVPEQTGTVENQGENLK